MNWTLAQLEIFVLAETEGSFSAAARHLGRAQSRVSSAIANLEEDLGFQLFDRSGKTPVLTKHGKSMFAEATAVLHQCQRLQSNALKIVLGDETKLTMAIEEAAPIDIFNDVFIKLAKEFPQIQLTIRHGSQDDIAQWTESGEADFGFVYRSNEVPELLEFRSLGSMSHCLIVANSHPLAKIQEPTIEDLNQYRQLINRDRRGIGDHLRVSSSHWDLDSYYYIVDLVVIGLGWTLAPQHIVGLSWYKDDLVILSPKKISVPLINEIGIIKRRDRAAGSAMSMLISEMDSYFTQK